MIHKHKYTYIVKHSIVPGPTYSTTHKPVASSNVMGINHRADGLADKATIPNGLRLGRSELLRSLRHYLQARNQKHATAIGFLEERCAKRGDAFVL